MAEQYEKDSISNFSRKEYLKFFRELFPLFKEHSKKDARIAFLNADWRDFSGMAAREEDPSKNILDETIPQVSGSSENDIKETNSSNNKTSGIGHLKADQSNNNGNHSHVQVYNIITGKDPSWQGIIYDLINSEQLDAWDIDGCFMCCVF